MRWSRKPGPGVGLPSLGLPPGAVDPATVTLVERAGEGVAMLLGLAPGVVVGLVLLLAGVDDDPAAAVGAAVGLVGVVVALVVSTRRERRAWEEATGVAPGRWRVIGHEGDRVVVWSLDRWEPGAWRVDLAWPRATTRGRLDPFWTVTLTAADGTVVRLGEAGASSRPALRAVVAGLLPDPP
jgi:xanthosine utilization system XapX-like protein